jgi:acyl carrier protein
VELGEIEAAMEEQEWVKEAVVVAREDERGEKRLIGYVVEEEGKEVREEEVRRRVREKLPEYMVPVTVMKIREAPLTPNGKIDHRALPEPPKLDDETGGRLVGTHSPIGEVLTGIWTDMLKHDAIDIDSNFFDIGGHSLMAIQVTSRIKDVFEVDLPIRSFFEAPTVAGLSALIADAQKGAHNGKAPPLTRSSRDSEAPASFAQSRLWFLDQLEPGCPFYNLPLAVRVGGRLDVRVLRESLNEIIKRHEVLRTTFAMVEGRPVQLIAETLAISVPVVDLSELHEQARENEARRLTAVEVSQAFDLAKGPLMRVCVFEFGPYDHEVIITMHHIVTDGWSQGIFVRELTRLYESIVAGRPPVLPELPVQYADFASWQHEWLHGPVLESQLSYWKRQLGGRLAVLELPTDHPRPLIQTFRGSRMSLVLSKELSEDLRGLSRREGVTLHMTMLAAFITLLYRYTGQEDILVGAPIANRNLVEVEGLIGFFVNTLVIRADLSKAPTFSDLLRQVRRVSLEAYTNQDLPLERLIEELQPERSLSYAPLFQVMFTFQNQPMGSIELDGLSLSPSQINNATAKFDLILNMWETERGFSGWLEYSTDLFESSTIARMLMHFERLLISIVTDSDSPLTELKMLSEEERILLEKPIEVDELDYSFLF